MTDKKSEYALMLLRQKFDEKGTLPKREDFSYADVCLIKQKLGPWPRALEAAGLKKPPPVSALEKNRARRERARQNRKKKGNLQ